MNDNIKTLISFAIGAAIGSVVTLKLIETKYRNISNDEINLMREYYKREEQKLKEQTNDISEDDTEEDEFTEVEMEEYHKITDNYSTESEKEETIKVEPADPYEDLIYIITPEEFGMEDYDEISLNYYKNGVLTDDMDVPCDIHDTVGFEAIDNMGVFEPYMVHVRNDVRKADYEVCFVDEDYIIDEEE